jgi:hypothetical protein
MAKVAQNINALVDFITILHFRYYILVKQVFLIFRILWVFLLQIALYYYEDLTNQTTPQRYVHPIHWQVILVNVNDACRAAGKRPSTSQVVLTKYGTWQGSCPKQDFYQMVLNRKHWQESWQTIENWNEVQPSIILTILTLLLLTLLITTTDVCGGLYVCMWKTHLHTIFCWHVTFLPLHNKFMLSIFAWVKARFGCFQDLFILVFVSSA